MSAIIALPMRKIEHTGSNKQKMNMQEKRRIALGAARSQLRHLGISLDRCLPFDDALAVLDELHRSEPDLIASQWYASASDHQIHLLRRERRKQWMQRGGG